MDPHSNFTQDRLDHAFECLSLTAPASLFDELRTRYSEESRAYHNVQHIDHCLREFDSCPVCPEKPCELELAIWFHDAIYDSRATDNELRSADLAAESLKSSKAAPESIAMVRAIILATTHDTPCETIDQQLMVDIDLSMLGVPPAAYRRLEEAVRQEYAWVPWAQYITGRVGVLRRFLRRKSIFTTPWFIDRYESIARTNLSQAIAELTSEG